MLPLTVLQPENAPGEPGRVGELSPDPLDPLCAGKGLIGLEVRVEVVQNLADAHHLVVVGGRFAVDSCLRPQPFFGLYNKRTSVTQIYIDTKFPFSSYWKGDLNTNHFVV